MTASLNKIDKSKKKLFYSMLLTGIIFLAEFIGGIWTGSLALLSDSAHMFMDVFALGLSYLAFRAATIPANEKHTYGYHRMQVLAALFNAASLLLISFEILREAITRFSNPQPIIAGPMLVIAVIGLVVNIIVAYVLHEHDHEDLNTRSAFLHVLGDTIASVGVIAAGIVIYFTNLTWIDPLVSVLISLLIIINSGKLLKATVHILAEGMPAGITVSQVTDTLMQIDGVEGMHDLHVWTISPTFISLSVHVIVEDQLISQSVSIMDQIKKVLKEKFNISHSTIQFECQSCGQCTDNDMEDEPERKADR